MRAVLLLALVGIAVAEIADIPWVEEEDLGETDYKDEHDRQKRDSYIDGPFEVHIRIKRNVDDNREAQAERVVRNPRQTHQYEVHESSDDGAMPSPPYEQMLASSAEHYHIIHPERSRSLNSGSHTFGAPEIVRAAAPPLAPAPVTHFASNQHANLAPAPVLNTAAPLNSVPLHAAPAAPVAEDLQPAAGHHKVAHDPYSHGYSGAGGHDHYGKHHSEHEGKHVKGSNSDHYLDKGGKGYRTDERHRQVYEEADGKKKKHHDNANHKGGHEEEAFGSRGAHFGERKAHKKGHKTKGFHNKYHKDESHKEHKFYDDFHKDGEHHRYGKFNAKHASNESGKKKVHHVNAGHDYTEHGKKGYSNKGHIDADHKGHKGKGGHEEHHQHHSQHGKRGGKHGGTQWGYDKKN